jgi:hypothetical protein
MVSSELLGLRILAVAHDKSKKNEKCLTELLNQEYCDNNKQQTLRQLFGVIWKFPRSVAVGRSILGGFRGFFESWRIAVRLFRSYTSVRITSASSCVSYAGLARAVQPRTRLDSADSSNENSVLPPNTALTVEHGTRFRKTNP